MNRAISLVLFAGFSISPGRAIFISAFSPRPLSVAYGEGRWLTLLREDSLWLGEASALNRL